MTVPVGSVRLPACITRSALPDRCSVTRAQKKPLLVISSGLRPWSPGPRCANIESYSALVTFRSDQIGVV